jgi:hypothetical protein
MGSDEQVFGAKQQACAEGQGDYKVDIPMNRGTTTGNDAGACRP